VPKLPGKFEFIILDEELRANKEGQENQENNVDNVAL
jgi:hypothetical protein